MKTHTHYQWKIVTNKCLKSEDTIHVLSSRSLILSQNHKNFPFFFKTWQLRQFKVIQMMGRDNHL